MGFSHPFTTNPGLAVALLDKPTYEGTVGLYLQLKDPQGGSRSKILGLTCCHVASPSSAATGLSIARAEAHPEYVITPDEETYEKGIRELNGHIGTLRSRISAREEEVEQYQQQQSETNDVTHNSKAKGQRLTSTSAPNANSGYIPKPPIESARVSLKHNTANLNELVPIQECVAALSLDKTQNRRVGRVYYADPISTSSDSDPFDAYTIDWALVEFDESAFGEGFTGNKVFIGGTDEPIKEYTKQTPISGRSNGFRSVLQIPTQWVKSEKDMLAGEHRDDKYGTNRVAVVKNGAGTGTTLGWLNGLDSYVRHTIQVDIPRSADPGSEGGATGVAGSASGLEPIVFESMETTILYLGANHGSFSEQGDSGAAILDSDGRFVALLTGSGGMAGLTDITFGTAAWKLMPQVVSAVPGVELWPVV
ncbi:hypothetical protein BJ165DRAFT_1495646 [Panaeolus papilionaceus]|nr:hypothetical protein BJ165DRAFT_1495646 [Panaeolus papilionaceus]